jgi:hypothetical protein
MRFRKDDAVPFRPIAIILIQFQVMEIQRGDNIHGRHRAAGMSLLAVLKYPHDIAADEVCLIFKFCDYFWAVSHVFLPLVSIFTVLNDKLLPHFGQTFL